MGQQYGDTTLTKVFVGGLAWETQKDVLKEHFDQYGEILEAVIISDKLTGYSKGYGFVTFKEAESAKKACDDATPMINGRRANCNLAALGARKSRSSPPAQAQQLPPATVMRAGGPPPATWYYHHAQGGPQPPAPAVHHHYPGMIPYYAAAAAAYGYSPPFMASLGYTAAKVGAGGAYVQGHYTYPAQGGIVAPNEMLPVYPVYHYHHHQSQNMGGMPAAAHFFNPSTTAIATIPAAATIISKPTVMPPAAVHLAMEQVTGCS